MAIERRLTEIAGPVGGKLHTARSRNDQVATDMAMFTRAHALGTVERLQSLQSALVQLADRHLDWPMPGYTHLQRAQPVYLAHHLLAYFWMFRRDARRFELVLGSTSELPLGAGALAGVNFETDRALVARELGFTGVARELDRRRLQPRLRARLPVRGGHLRDPPVAPGGRDRAVVERGVRLLRGLGRVGVGLLDHAAEEEPRRGRAAAGEGAARGGAPERPARGDARPPADLQQGHAGGQGAPVRRRRHARPVPAGGDRDALRHVVRPRADGRRRLRRDDRRRRRRRHARAPRRAVPPVARHRGRAGARGGVVGPDAVAAHARRAGAALRGRWTTSTTRSSRASRGSSRRSPRAAPRSTACESSSRTRARSSTSSRLDPRARLLRPPGRRGGARPARVRGALRRHRRA